MCAHDHKGAEPERMNGATQIHLHFWKDYSKIYAPHGGNQLHTLAREASVRRQLFKLKMNHDFLLINILEECTFM